MDNLFRDYDLSASLRNQPSVIRAEVDGYGEDYLLGASEDDLVAFLSEKFAFNPPVLGDAVIASDAEVEIERQIDDFGRRIPVRVKETRIVLHIPFQGDGDFFKVRPEQSQWTTPQATVRPSHLELVFQGQGIDGNAVKSGLSKFLGDVEFHLSQITQAAKAHNESLPGIIRPMIQTRKQRILDRRQMVSAIGLPIKRRDDAPTTFTVPDIRRRPEIKPPKVNEKAFVPEPALADSEYENILTIMRGMVRVMEASPHAFASLKEEDIRQHFLMQLNGQYQGRATGETFNYEGKTDILIREADRNVFIAECKFWKGKESLLGTVDQVLGYLHWRDTKAAIVIFNRNKDFTNVLSQIASTMESHGCFKRMVRKVNETEWRFIFHNNDDRNRELHLAVLAFDIPISAAATKG